MLPESFFITKSETSWLSKTALKNLRSAWFFHDEDSFEKFASENPFVFSAKPLVKWVGGKRSIVKNLEGLMPETFGNYFEPFLGWASVFFTVMKKGSQLSDLNSELVNMYSTVKSKPEELIAFIKTLSYDEDTYYSVRAWDRIPEWTTSKSDVERAWRFLYLNKTCFNWVYRVNSKGENNVPMWRYKNPDFVQEDNIRDCSKLFNLLEVEFHNRPYGDIEKDVGANDFVYLDPPYDVLTETANFTAYDKEWFWRDEQKALAEFVKRISEKGAFAMVSNHETDFIKEIYSGFRISTLDVKRAVSGKNSWRNPVSEVIVTNYGKEPQK